ncbi:efflux RND transporter periplasmic adaptor subunit [Paenibacillus sp. YPG26]|uniref:efflux RND transporter periplasmic adaptor subunit n=1 Tax=Paenibacillus sp. YPG26 TaxID=2878915 RepID=UPI00203D5105|nr:efflux RND transporter periplasmic adaptor subunit [Paenibacillus sp. YPG26]USB32284.1 efflux RND transporter periplasmic adaptor subunit [Paenibacillus sp. YPG26]
MIVRLYTKKRAAKWMITAACLALTTTAAGCSSASPVEQAQVQAGIPKVKVEPIKLHSMGAPLEQIADVNASVQVGVIAQGSGTITEILKNNGDKVTKGQVIARISAGTAHISVVTAEASVSSAERALQSAQLELESNRAQLARTISGYEKQMKEAIRANNEELYNTTRDNLESSKEQLKFLESKSSVPAAKSQLETAKVSLAQAKANLEAYNITAPSSGTLAELAITVGASVTQGSKVCLVLNANQITIQAELSEDSAERVRGKKKVRVYYADQPKVGREIRVAYLSGAPSTTTRLYTLQLTADNKDAFFVPGSRVQVQLTTEEEENVLAVPTGSIVRDGNNTYVFVLKGDKAQRVQIELGRLGGMYQEILGVSAGDKLIVSGQHTLKDGEKVQTQ